MSDESSTERAADRTIASDAETRARRRLRRLRDLASGLLPLSAAALLLHGRFPLPPTFTALVVVLFGIQVLILSRLPAEPAAGPGLGPADRLTLARSALVLPLLALALWPAVPTEGLWWLVGLGATALVLDGIDGIVARRTGTVTRFGARFDMEVDNLLLVALSALVWRTGATGPWVLLIGAMRYLFVLAARLRPELARELPPSFRRKTVCVLQGVALLACLAPLTSPAAATTIAATALAALAYSFGVDVVTALRHDR